MNLSVHGSSVKGSDGKIITYFNYSIGAYHVLFLRSICYKIKVKLPAALFALNYRSKISFSFIFQSGSNTRTLMSRENLYICLLTSLLSKTRSQNIMRSHTVTVQCDVTIDVQNNIPGHLMMAKKCHRHFLATHHIFMVYFNLSSLFSLQTSTAPFSFHKNKNVSICSYKIFHILLFSQ